MKEIEKDAFVEEIIDDRPIKRPSKLIIGKKTILKKKKLSSPSPPPPLTSQKEQNMEKKSNAEYLVESIVKTYWVSKWKEQLLIMKYSKQGFNKKRGTFRSFCMKMNNAMKYHQYLYLAKLFDKMEALPKKETIVHYKNYGKLMLVKNNNNNDNIINIKNINDEDKKIENEINNEIEININLPEIHEVDYKPENDEKNFEMKNNEKIHENNIINMDIEENNEKEKIKEINKENKKE